MLTIVESMKHWRHYFEGSCHSVQVLSDHRNLKVFMSTKVLNWQQAQWAELLANTQFLKRTVRRMQNNDADAKALA